MSDEECTTTSATLISDHSSEVVQPYVTLQNETPLPTHDLQRIPPTATTSEDSFLTQLTTYLQNYPNYEPFLYPSLDNSTWIKSHGGYHLNLTKKNSPDTPGQFSITGTIRNEDCTLTTLGNWSAQGKTTLDSAKLTIALCVPDNPLLATAFRQNIKTIESLKKSALQFFSKGSAAIATQSAPRTSPTKHSPPCSETYYSIRPGKSSKLNGPHFRHKLFIKLDECLSFKRKAAMKLTSFDWNPQYEGSSNDLVIYRWPAPKEAEAHLNELIPTHDTCILPLITSDGKNDHHPGEFDFLLKNALVTILYEHEAKLVKGTLYFGLDVIEVRIHEAANSPQSDPDAWDDPGNFTVRSPKKKRKLE